MLKEILSKKTIAHSVITLFGTFINGILGILFFVVLARSLGPDNFGLVSFAIVTLTLFGDIADFGINTGIINFVSKYITADMIKAYRFMKLGLKYKFLSWIFVLILGFLFSDLVSVSLLNKPELSGALKLSIIGVGGALLFSFVANCLQALQKFLYWSILNIFLNSLRLISIIILIFLGLLNYQVALITYIALPFFGFFIGLMLLPKNFLKVKGEEEERKFFLDYNKWVALSVTISALSSRIDTILVAKFLRIYDVGLYSVATQLTSTIPQIVYAIAVVVAPKLSSHTIDREAFGYLKKVQLYTLGLSLLGLVAIPLSYYLIPLIYSADYSGSVGPFIILLISQLIFLSSIPAHQAIFYYFSKPKTFVIISLIQMVIIFIVSIKLIPTYGITCAAYAVLTGSIFNFIFTNIWYLREFKKRL